MHNQADISNKAIQLTIHLNTVNISHADINNKIGLTFIVSKYAQMYIWMINIYVYNLSWNVIISPFMNATAAI